jgi:hypothetical protein
MRERPVSQATTENNGSCNRTNLATLNACQLHLRQNNGKQHLETSDVNGIASQKPQRRCASQFGMSPRLNKMTSRQTTLTCKGEKNTKAVFAHKSSINETHAEANESQTMLLAPCVPTFR